MDESDTKRNRQTLEEERELGRREDGRPWNMSETEFGDHEERRSSNRESGQTPEASDENRLTPAEAFAVIGNETRLEILYELRNASEDAVSFSDLRRRVGMRDGSQFNYHLSKLAGQFIRKTDEGYVLRTSGAYVIKAVEMGAYTENVRLDPFEIESTCIGCESPLHARYDDGMMFVACSACERVHDMGPFPPAGIVGRTNGEVIGAYHHWTRAHHVRALNGVCWGCGGPMTRSLMRDREDMPNRIRDEVVATYDLGVKYECERCLVWHTATVGAPLLFHPDVIGFYRDHGVDLTTRPYWELDWYVSDERTTVLSEDPRLFRVTIPLDDEELRVTLDDDLSVVESERSTATPAANANGTS